MGAPTSLCGWVFLPPHLPWEFPPHIFIVPSVSVPVVLTMIVHNRGYKIESLRNFSEMLRHRLYPQRFWIHWSVMGPCIDIFLKACWDVLKCTQIENLWLWTFKFSPTLAFTKNQTCEACYNFGGFTIGLQGSQGRNYIEDCVAVDQLMSFSLTSFPFRPPRPSQLHPHIPCSHGGTLHVWWSPLSLTQKAPPHLQIVGFWGVVTSGFLKLLGHASVLVHLAVILFTTSKLSTSLPYSLHLTKFLSSLRSHPILPIHQPPHGFTWHGVIDFFNHILTGTCTSLIFSSSYHPTSQLGFMVKFKQRGLVEFQWSGCQLLLAICSYSTINS